MTYLEKIVSKNTMRRYCGPVIVAFSMLVGLTSAAQAEALLRYSTDGAVVTDSKTGLTWQRCSVGQTWTGTTCFGTATAYTHENALIYAQSQIGWRLPNVKELASLVNLSVIKPSIDSVAFPATSAAWFWTTTPGTFSPFSLDDAPDACAVDFQNGGVIYRDRGERLLVRLVR